MNHDCAKFRDSLLSMYFGKSENYRIVRKGIYNMYFVASAISITYNWIRNCALRQSSQYLVCSYDVTEVVAVTMCDLILSPHFSHDQLHPPRFPTRRVSYFLQMFRPDQWTHNLQGKFAWRNGSLLCPPRPRRRSLKTLHSWFLRGGHGCVTFLSTKVRVALSASASNDPRPDFTNEASSDATEQTPRSCTVDMHRCSLFAESGHPTMNWWHWKSYIDM